VPVLCAWPADWREDSSALRVPGLYFTVYNTLGAVWLGQMGMTGLVGSTVTSFLCAASEIWGSGTDVTDAAQGSGMADASAGCAV